MAPQAQAGSLSAKHCETKTPGLLCKLLSGSGRQRPVQQTRC